MKLCFTSAYLETSRGGGERHVLSIALAAASAHAVSVAIPGVSNTKIDSIKKELEHFVGQSLDKLTFLAAPKQSAGFLQLKSFYDQFDGLFWVCDGSIPGPLTKKRYLHIQIPFTNSLSLIEKFKYSFWQKHANANSEFTQAVVQAHWQTNIPSILWPLVQLSTAASSPQETQKKKAQILSVGRFFKHLHAKRQDVLIAAFKQLVDSAGNLPENVELVLIGEIEDHEYVKQLQQQAAGYNVTFLHGLQRAELEKYLHQAVLYWHAAGFEIDEQQHPEQVEHFGISVGEAMAAGAIPLVVPKGGVCEVVGSELLAACSWNNIDECVALSRNILSNSQLLSSLRTQAVAQVQQFGLTAFNQRVTDYFS